MLKHGMPERGFIRSCWMKNVFHDAVIAGLLYYKTDIFLNYS